MKCKAHDPTVYAFVRKGECNAAIRLPNAAA